MNEELIAKQIESRKNELMYYAPTSFFRKNVEQSFEYFVKKEILVRNKNKVFEVNIGNETFSFLYEFLSWDSEFFNMPTYKLNFILFDDQNYQNLLKAIAVFKEEVIKNSYVFIEIPSEDIFVIQALNESLFRLVETRMTYYLDLNKFENSRYNIREAVMDDIPNLMKISSEMVNPYDRFHADVFIDKESADSFLGVFAQESVKGFADIVLVPNEKDIPADSFITAKYYKNWWNEIDLKVSKMVLSAVSSKTNKGWYIKLMSELAYHLKDQGADFAILHPASTNKALIHSTEKLGSKLGKVNHILTYMKR